MQRLTRPEKQLRQKLASNIKSLRESAGLTIQGLAEKGGLHWRHLQKVEAGEVNATLQTLARLADALEIDAGKLLS